MHRSGGASRTVRKGLSQESHVSEQRSLGWGSPVSFPSFHRLCVLPFQPGDAAPCPGLFPGHPAPITSGTAPAFPKACFGGRGGQQAGQGNYLARCFAVRNRPVVSGKAWMWQQASPGKLASCPVLRLAAAAQLLATGSPGRGRTRRSQAHVRAPLTSLGSKIKAGPSAGPASTTLPCTSTVSLGGRYRSLSPKASREQETSLLLP